MACATRHNSENKHWNKVYIDVGSPLDDANVVFLQANRQYRPSAQSKHTPVHFVSWRLKYVWSDMPLFPQLCQDEREKEIACYIGEHAH